MPVQFEFVFPRRYRDAVLQMAREWGASVHGGSPGVVAPGGVVERVVSSIERGTETVDDEQGEVISVVVDYDATSALEAALWFFHSKDAPDNSGGGGQHEWEDWCWHALHMLKPFHDASIVDHLGRIE